MKFDRVKLHPATCKYIKMGHPWITTDSFTKNFPQNTPFLIGCDEKSTSPIAFLLNDPLHKNIKARVWDTKKLTYQSPDEFLEELKTRIENSFKKRKNLNISNFRENFYLVKAENDFIPGLEVLYLNQNLIIQYFAFYWSSFETELVKLLHHYFNVYFSNYNLSETWIQERNFKQEKKFRSLSGKFKSNFIVKEFEINYQIKLNQNYDFGIYTDMSGIRKELTTYFQKSSSFLNLFSYTGAFSLFALSNGVKDVYSVDLSEKYLNWLNENLKLNPNLNSNYHTAICSSVENALQKFTEVKKNFDFIICDPPTASSDGKSLKNVLKTYENLLPLMLNILSPSGKLLVFVNTHTISMQKFESKIKEINNQLKLKRSIKIPKKFKLTEDCIGIKEFPEGDYIKGCLIEFE